MTIEERIASLQESVMEEARAQADEITRRHEKMLKSVLNQHKSEAKKQFETRLRVEKISSRQQKNLAISKAQLALKREYGKRQRELKIELFKEVKEELQEFMKTEEYMRLMVAYIERAARFANGQELTIYINPTDADKKEYLEEHTGLKLTISKEDFVGGIRAVVHDRNVLIDHAYKGAIEQQYQTFVFRGGAGIG